MLRAWLQRIRDKLAARLIGLQVPRPPVWRLGRKVVVLTHVYGNAIRLDPDAARELGLKLLSVGGRGPADPTPVPADVPPRLSPYVSAQTAHLN